jgi:uncharacterized protein (TIGR00369 family)
VRQGQDKGGTARPADPVGTASQPDAGAVRPARPVPDVGALADAVADDGAAGDESAERARRVMAAFGTGYDQTLVGRMGIKIVEASAQRAVATMPVAGNTQPYGLLHGGASCVLAETLGSLAAALHAGPGKLTVGIEISASHHRAASSGLVTAVATMAHGGSTLATYDIVITDDRQRRVCTARLSCLLLDREQGQGLGGVVPPGAPGDV